MARTRRYKKVEKNIALNVIGKIGRFFKFIKNGFVFLLYKVNTKPLIIQLI